MGGGFGGGDGLSDERLGFEDFGGVGGGFAMGCHFC